MGKNRKIILAKDEKNNLPLLLTFPGVDINKNINFSLYKKTNCGPNSHQCIIYANANRLEYKGNTLLDSPALPCKYALGVYNKEKKEIAIREAKVVDMNINVKNLDNIEIKGKKRGAESESRRSLGQTFGTKKARSAISAFERGQIDISTVNCVSKTIKKTIRNNSKVKNSESS
jgi:DNA-directed RNA polymerase I subunit RPA49